MYMYLNTFIFTHTHIYTCIRIFIYIYTNIHTWVFIYIYSYIHVKCTIGPHGWIIFSKYYTIQKNLSRQILMGICLLLHVPIMTSVTVSLEFVIYWVRVWLSWYYIECVTYCVCDIWSWGNGLGLLVTSRADNDVGYIESWVRDILSSWGF